MILNIETQQKGKRKKRKGDGWNQSGLMLRTTARQARLCFHLRFCQYLFRKLHYLAVWWGNYLGRGGRCARGPGAWCARTGSRRGPRPLLPAPCHQCRNPPRTWSTARSGWSSTSPAHSITSSRSTHYKWVRTILCASCAVIHTNAPCAHSCNLYTLRTNLCAVVCQFVRNVVRKMRLNESQPL